jgi:hypothetical protein
MMILTLESSLSEIKNHRLFLRSGILPAADNSKTNALEAPPKMPVRLALSFWLLLGNAKSNVLNRLRLDGSIE